MFQLLSAQAQTTEPGEKFAIKATADIGIGKVLNTKSNLSDLSYKSSGSDFGIDFGWKFWNRKSNSLEANIGVGYSHTSLTADLGKLNYNYSASALADMDGVPYIRYYELGGIHQKIAAERVSVPIYLNYQYQFSKVFGIHALAGIKLGFNVSSKVKETNGTVFSYGVYPQYDNLMIDAPYMNEFGEAILDTDRTRKPEANSLTTSCLLGVGAEVRVGGPFAIDVSLRYEGGFNDMFKKAYNSSAAFNAENAPVRYTVAEGQTAASLSNYLNSSKIAKLSCAISLICRF